MALSELAAIEAAYHALQSLDEAGRGRALRWLSDALEAPVPLAEAIAAAAIENSVPAEPAARSEDGVKPTRRAAGSRSARQGRRRPAPAEGTRTAPKKADVATARRGRRRTETAATGERVYRRMPGADEVMAAYQEVGTVSGLAQHFGVPVHTAQGWARRLRQKGHQIGRQDKG